MIEMKKKHRTVVYDLTPEQLGQTGTVLENNQKKQEEFRETFSDLAEKIIALTSTSTYAVSA